MERKQTSKTIIQLNSFFTKTDQSNILITEDKASICVSISLPSLGDKTPRHFCSSEMPNSSC